MSISRKSGADRIAIVSHTHPSLSKGGAEFSAYALYQGLIALGHDVIFIAAVPHGDRERLVLSSAREFAVFHDPEHYDHFFHIGGLEIARQLEELIEQTGVSVINFHHFMNFGLNTIGAIAERTDIRTIFTIHEFLAICQNHGQMITRPYDVLCDEASPGRCISCFPQNSLQQFALRERHVKSALASVDRFVSPSKFLAARFVDWGLPASRISVIENGLLRRPARQSPQRQLSASNWTFGYFGQITPFKGVNVLLDACDLIATYEDLPEKISIRVHGNMVGQSADFLSRFEESVQKHSFLHYAGSYDNRSVSQLMADCDYILMTSKWWENSPVVIQEAYAVGRPVICPAIGGMAEKVRAGESGLHFRRGDHAHLLRVLEAATNTDMYDHLVANLPMPADATEMASAYLEAGLIAA